MSSGQTSFSERAVLLNGAGFLARSSSGLGPGSTLSVSDARTLMGAQASDPTLTALAGVTVSADQLVYATGTDTFATTSLTSFARSILDDADASTVRTTIGAQATLVSGTNIRTINGNSLLGNTDLTISGGSGSPGGSSTQIQLNTSGAFDATSRLTWTSATGLAVQTTGDNAICFRINPRTDAEYTHNVPFVMSAGAGAIQTGIGTLAANVSAYNFGLNMELGGGPGELFSATQPAIGIRLESNYITNRRGINERFVEYHLTYTPMHTTGNVIAGTHIRIMSFEVGTGFNVNTGVGELGSYINGYCSAGAFDFRNPHSNNALSTVYFAVQSGGLKLSDANGVGVNAFEITHDAAYTQFTTTGTFIFGRNTAISASFSVLDNVTIQSTNASSALVVYGGITAGGEIYSNAQGLKSTKSVTANNSFALYAYATYGTPTTEPAGLTGAIIQIVKINGSNLELHAKGPTGATVLLATLAAS